MITVDDIDNHQKQQRLPYDDITNNNNNNSSIIISSSKVKANIMGRSEEQQQQQHVDGNRALTFTRGFRLAMQQAGSDVKEHDDASHRMRIPEPRSVISSSQTRANSRRFERYDNHDHRRPDYADTRIMSRQNRGSAQRSTQDSMQPRVVNRRKLIDSELIIASNMISRNNPVPGLLIRKATPPIVEAEKSQPTESQKWESFHIELQSFDHQLEVLTMSIPNLLGDRQQNALPFMDMINGVVKAYRDCAEADFVLCITKKQIDVRAWYNIFHKIIERLRHQWTSGQSSAVQEVLCKVMQLAARFYRHLITLWRDISSESLESTEKETNSNTMVGRWLLIIGDLSRYSDEFECWKSMRNLLLNCAVIVDCSLKPTHNGTALAESVYLLACQREPCNPTPYYKLAVLEYGRHNAAPDDPKRLMCDCRCLQNLYLAFDRCAGTDMQKSVDDVAMSMFRRMDKFRALGGDEIVLYGALSAHEYLWTGIDVDIVKDKATQLVRRYTEIKTEGAFVDKSSTDAFLNKVIAIRSLEMFPKRVHPYVDILNKCITDVINGRNPTNNNDIDNLYTLSPSLTASVASVGSSASDEPTAAEEDYYESKTTDNLEGLSMSDDTLQLMQERQQLAVRLKKQVRIAKHKDQLGHIRSSRFKNRERGPHCRLPSDLYNHQLKLVLDTNSILASLSLLKLLSDYHDKCELIVPGIVKHELAMIASRERKRWNHGKFSKNNSLYCRAAAAIEWFETVAGTHFLSFVDSGEDEPSSDYPKTFKNDSLVLKCCERLMKKEQEEIKSREISSHDDKDPAVVLILLTCDRILSIRASAFGLPCRSPASILGSLVNHANRSRRYQDKQTDIVSKTDTK